jgi:hypothetical protein
MAKCVGVASVYIPSFWYSAIALSCCRCSFAHFVNSSWADTAPISRFRRTISFFNFSLRCADVDVEVGSLLYRTHNYGLSTEEAIGGAGGCTSSLSVLTPTVLMMWRDSWSMKTTSRREGMVVEVSRAVVRLSAWCGEKGVSLCHIVGLPRWEGRGLCAPSHHEGRHAVFYSTQPQPHRVRAGSNFPHDLR